LYLCEGNRGGKHRGKKEEHRTEPREYDFPVTYWQDSGRNKPIKASRQNSRRLGRCCNTRSKRLTQRKIGCGDQKTASQSAQLFIQEKAGALNVKTRPAADLATQRRPTSRGRVGRPHLSDAYLERSPGSVTFGRQALV
jgi:hypothetical protein